MKKKSTTEKKVNPRKQVYMQNKGQKSPNKKKTGGKSNAY